MLENNKIVPVTIVTGFLGSGKTTLINNILTLNHGKKIAVIMNEIGDVNLDGELIVQSQSEELKIMNNGCVCCTVRGDLARICKDFVKNKKVSFDYLIIETTGLADPSPVAQTFFMDPELQNHYCLDGIVTVVDACHIWKNLTEVTQTQFQIGFADVVLINKIDLVSQDELKNIDAQIAKINSFAKRIFTQNSSIDINKILDIKAFDLDFRYSLQPDLLVEGKTHTHDAQIQSIYLEEKKPLDLEKLNNFMTLLINELGDQILRSKGVVYLADEPRRTVFQGVHMSFTSVLDRPWNDGETRKTQMVFIGRYLPKELLAEGLSLCVSASAVGN